MRREAREAKARNDRLVQEAREAAAARAAAEELLVADQSNSEAEMQKILELRSQVAKQKEELTSLSRRVEDGKVHWRKEKKNKLIYSSQFNHFKKEREKEAHREREAALARVQELKAAIAVKELEVENARQKAAALETRLERSKAVIEAQQKQLERTPAGQWVEETSNLFFFFFFF